jgi:hypothetical protein
MFSLTTRRFICGLGVMGLAVALSACAASPAKPTMAITGISDGATVKGPKVKVEVAVTNWKLTPAGSALAAGEGHLHFFVDVPASSIASGQAIPATDANPAYVHAGKDPLSYREIQLAPGKHTVTVVMGNSSHQALSDLAPQTVTFNVE